MEFAITISGLHGTGKSTYARNIAESFALKHVSIGELFRQIALERKLSITDLSREAEKDSVIDRLLDDRTKDEIRKGNVVIDSLLAGWFAQGCNAVKIYLSTPYKTRIDRIACRDRISYAEAETFTSLREQIERRRFKRLYDIDIDNLSIYDLILNTDLMPKELNIEVIKCFIEGYMKSHGVNK
ncbi:MAG: cytidylate kinase family protein [Candidatus Bathyarchaeota archaeon]